MSIIFSGNSLQSSSRDFIQILLFFFFTRYLPGFLTHPWIALEFRPGVSQIVPPEISPWNFLGFSQDFFPNFFLIISAGSLLEFYPECIPSFTNIFSRNFSNRLLRGFWRFFSWNVFNSFPLHISHIFYRNSFKPGVLLRIYSTVSPRISPEAPSGRQGLWLFQSSNQARFLFTSTTFLPGDVAFSRVVVSTVYGLRGFCIRNALLGDFSCICIVFVDF